MESRGKKLVQLARSKKSASQNIPENIEVLAAHLPASLVTAPAPVAFSESSTAVPATPILIPAPTVFSEGSTELSAALVPAPAPAELSEGPAVPKCDNSHQHPQEHSSTSSESSSSSSDESDSDSDMSVENEIHEPAASVSKSPQNSDRDANSLGIIISAPNSPSILENRDKNTDSMSTDTNSINEAEIFDDTRTGDFSCTGTSDEYKPSSSSSSDSSSSSSSSSSSDSDSERTPVTFDVNQEPESSKKERSREKKSKKNKNSGKQYTSITTGKVVKAKAMGPPCNCRLWCYRKFTNEKRLAIFKAYWELGSVDRHRDFLNSCMRSLNIASRRVVTGRNSRPRKANTGFYLLCDGKEFRVCKLFLINTLGITQRIIRTVIEAKHKTDGIIPEDMRGKHGKQCKLDDEIKKSVRDQIESIPTIESHYLRASTSRLFIDGGLTIAEMHRNYTEKQNKNNAPAANYDAYSRIFNHEYNIGFFIPKKDQCDECEGYKNAPEEQKASLHASYKLHLEEKSLSRIEKDKDMKECQETGSNSIVVTYDLQAVMPCPVGNSSAFFYKSRLNCYNFTMSDGRNHVTTCFFWHEGIGNRGAIEIGSCVYKFLESVASSNPGCDVTFYSDNCCGQHKNKFVFAMYFYAVTKLAINSIQHKFLIRGHTQNEGDAAHSIIERAITRAKKSGSIYVPDQYISLIRGAKKTGKPFVVKEMNYNDFFDSKEMSVMMNFNMTKNVNGDVIKITDIKSVKFTKNCDTYQYRTTFKTENWYEAKAIIETRGRRLRANDARSTIDIADITLKPAYTSKIPIAERKKRDLLHLVETNIVPRYYEQFFRDLV